MNEHVDHGVLIDYLHRELEPEQDAVVYAHLTVCADCAASYDAEARLSERLRADAQAAEREFPPRVTRGVFAAIDASRMPAWLAQLRIALRPAVGLPVAAVVALALALGFSSLTHPPHAPSIAASYYLDDHAALSSSSLPFSQTAVVPGALEQGSGNGSGSTAAVGANTIASE